MNMFLLELGLSPAIIAGSQPGHMDMKLGDIMTAISTAHMAMHGMHLPLQLLEPAPSLSEGRLVMNVVLDQGNVPTPSGDLRQDESHVVVLDGMCSESERQELLGWLTAPDHDHSGPPPEDKWELGCVDRMGDEPTWGLQTHMLQALRDEPPPALQAVHSRLAQLYPEFEMCHMPADALEGEHEDETGLSSFVANAVMPGDPVAWHVDADPSALPPSSPWVEHFGWYVNREPGRPLFVSVLLYLNDAWPEEFHAETLFLDPATQTGVFSRPAPGRMVLMDQDMSHRISVPSSCAGGPRYSLVWKLVWFRRSADCAARLARPDWGQATRFGSACPALLRSVAAG